MAGKAAIGAVATNPTNGTVLATTGSLTSGGQNGSGNYIVRVLVSSSAAATFDLQSIFNGSAVAHIYVMVPANSSGIIDTSPISFAVPDGITLQVVNVGGITGTVQANIFYTLETLN